MKKLKRRVDEADRAHTLRLVVVLTAAAATMRDTDYEDIMVDVLGAVVSRASMFLGADRAAALPQRTVAAIRPEIEAMRSWVAGARTRGEALGALASMFLSSTVED
jgi:hypothetical protein